MNKWKLTAIIFIILFVAETSFVGYGFYLIEKDTKDYYECLYNICEDYPEANFETPICRCYDYDVLGNFVIAKSEYIN